MLGNDERDVNVTLIIQCVMRKDNVGRICRAHTHTVYRAGI